MWRNFRCTNKQCVQLMGFYCNLKCFVAKSVIHAVLSRNFCHNLRAFMWRKIEPKSTFVEKKMTNIRSDNRLKNCQWTQV